MYLQRIADELKRTLSTQFRIANIKGMGKIEIEYYSQDARIARLIELRVNDGNVERVRMLINNKCMKLLSNPVIKNFQVNIGR